MLGDADQTWRCEELPGAAPRAAMSKIEPGQPGLADRRRRANLRGVNESRELSAGDCTSVQQQALHAQSHQASEELSGSKDEWKLMMEIEGRVDAAVG